MKRKKLEKMASNFLWQNAGHSVGCYGGGKRVSDKMPWNKIMKKGS